MSTDQATFEERWLAYARKVLAQDSGCPCDDDEIAWPGYIGMNYARGRVLIVGSIHNAPVLKSSGIYDIVEPVRTWLSSDSAAADQEYLDTVRAAYRGAIPKWIDYQNETGRWVKGAVWNGIKKVVKDFGLTYDDIAFTNAAKCGLPSGTSWPIEKPRIQKHQTATPLMKLINDLEPRYVLIAKDRRGLRELLALTPRAGTVTRMCHNLTFVSDGIPQTEWLPADAAAFRATAS